MAITHCFRVPHWNHLSFNHTGIPVLLSWKATDVKVFVQWTVNEERTAVIRPDNKWATLVCPWHVKYKKKSKRITEVFFLTCFIWEWPTNTVDWSHETIPEFGHLCKDVSSWQSEENKTSQNLIKKLETDTLDPIISHSCIWSVCPVLHPKKQYLSLSLSLSLFLSLFLSAQQERHSCLLQNEKPFSAPGALSQRAWL